MANPRKDFNLVRFTPSVRLSIRLVGLVTACFALYIAKPLFVPIFLAIIIALVLGPFVNGLMNLHVPAALASTIVLSGFAFVTALAVAIFQAPLSELLDEIPRVLQELRFKLANLQASFSGLEAVTREVSEITGGDGNTDADIDGGDILSSVLSNAAAVFSTIIFTFVLAFFLLTSREMFLKKIIRISPRLSDKKRALTIARAVEQDVSIYLLTIAAINSVLGMCIATAFWILGMPMPILWGVIAAVLNFLPYLGAWIGTASVAAIALITFESASAALVFPAVYLLATTLEGQFITPAIIGKRFSMNTVVVLLSLGVWGFLWGPIGVFVAMPFLIVLKALSDRMEGWEGFNEFLSGEEPHIENGGEPEAVRQATAR